MAVTARCAIDEAVDHFLKHVSASKPSRTARSTLALDLFVLGALVAAFYMPSTLNNFVYDDWDVIVAQQTPDSLRDFGRIFAERHYPHLPYYRPVARTTLLLQKALHGNRPAPFHAVNAVLMGMMASAVYALLRLPVFGITRAAALTAAAVVALHPVASSTVYPVASGRETLLAVLLMVVALYAFLREGTGWRTAAIAGFAAALLAKEQAIVFPLILVLADALGLTERARPASLTGYLRRHGPFALIVVLYLALRTTLFRRGEHLLIVLDDPSGPLYSLMFAVQTVAAPFQELVYEPTQEVWLSVPRVMVATVVCAGLGAGAFWMRRAHRRRTLLWPCWFLIGLAPTANFFWQEARFDERYVLFSIIGAAGMGATLASELWKRQLARRWVSTAALALVVAFAVMSWTRRSYFRDDSAFYHQWLKTNPASLNALLGVGNELLARGDPSGAVNHFRKALDIEPDLVAAHDFLRDALVRLGEQPSR